MAFRKCLGHFGQNLPDELFVLPSAIAQVILDDRGHVTTGAWAEQSKGQDHASVSSERKNGAKVARSIVAPVAGRLFLLVCLVCLTIFHHNINLLRFPINDSIEIFDHVLMIELAQNVHFGNQLLFLFRVHASVV